MSEPVKSISYSEWLVVSFFLILISSLIIIAKLSSWKVNAYISELRPEETILVQVSGEVVRAGGYEMPAGSLCRDLLQKISLKRFADISQIDPEAQIPPSLTIPRLERVHVRIEVEGVGSQELFLPLGTRVSELKSKVALDPMSDLTPFCSRRMLLDGEVLLVKKRKSKGKGLSPISTIISGSGTHADSGFQPNFPYEQLLIIPQKKKKHCT